MATQESLPSAGTEYIHVRSDSSGIGICALHGFPATVLQTSASTACAASKAVVIGDSVIN